MSFRRNGDAAQKWKTWRQKHRDELLACGVSHLVLDSEHYWHYFLDHGYFKPEGLTEPIIDVDQMERNEAERLCLFLGRSNYAPTCYVLNRLQYLLKRGRHAGTGT